MTNSFNRIRTWTEQKQVSIPSLFFKMYKEIGVTDEEALVLMHIMAFQAEGNEFPTPVMLEERSGNNSNEVSMLYQRLIQKGLLELKQDSDENGIYYEKFSLYPIWERLLNKLEQQQTVQVLKQDKLDDRAIYTLLEQELGRLLSPIEIETVGMWLDQDQHSPEMIKEAIKEAVLANKTSLRYIDRILFEWKKKNFKTIEQVQKQAEQFRGRTVNTRPTTAQAQKAEQPTEKKSGFYNWLDERE